MKTQQLKRASLSIVSMKFLENQLQVEAMLHLADTRAPLSFTIPLTSAKTNHIKAYKELLETTVMEYLSNEGPREEADSKNNT